MHMLDRILRNIKGLLILKPQKSKLLLYISGLEKHFDLFCCAQQEIKEILSKEWSNTIIPIQTWTCQFSFSKHDNGEPVPTAKVDQL